MTLSPTPVPNQLTATTAPKEGEKIEVITLDFSVTSTYTLDFSNQQFTAVFSSVKCMFIDNSLNNATLSLYNPATNATIIAPPNSQGIYPAFAPNPVKMTAICSGGAVAQVCFLNVAYPISTWRVTSSSTTLTNLAAVTVTDNSIASPTTGSSQPLLAANSARKYLMIYVADVTWVNPSGGTAAANGAGCFQMPANSTYESFTPWANAITYFQTANTKPIAVLQG